ncbi:NepR family anti-sigma factor [Oceaniglobus indicus]|nr:NepR family anti-sigma factor [Oceaniglobus indicus]
MKHIDENLRRVYRDVEQDEVPDRFKLLLDRLREQEKSNDK